MSEAIGDVEQLTQENPPLLGPYDYPVFPPYKNSLSGNCPEMCCYKRKIGRFYVCWEAKNGKPLCMMGPCWPMFFVTFLIIAASTSLLLGFLTQKSIVLCSLGAILCFFTLLAFSLTALRDPGIVPRRQDRLETMELYDSRALSYRPVNSIFEYETGTLVQDVDHFCPWTSVGCCCCC